MKEKAMHTLGPWKHFDGSRFITGTYNGIDTPLAEICVLPRKDKFPGYDGRETLTDLADAEMQLNADVMAAAPDMLEALEQVDELATRQIRGGTPEQCHTQLAQLRALIHRTAQAAIAKAKGASILDSRTA